MHFLAHYYYELPDNRPLFVAGLVIPDLARGFLKKHNRLSAKHVLYNTEGVKQVEEGVERHYAGDKAFHNSPEFISNVKMLTGAFVDEGLNRQRLRLSVIAHLAVELMLDRRIMLENENICADYYRALEQADEEVVTEYFELNYMPSEKRKFMVKFIGFKESRFLFKLVSMESIVYGLNRIYSTVTHVEFTNQESAKFLTVLDNNDLALRYSVKEI